MEKNAPKQVWRTRLLVYPKFQLGLIALNLLVMSCTFIAIAYFVDHSYAQLRAEGLAANLPSTHAYFKFIDYQAEMVFTYVAIALSGGFLVTAGLTLILSHKLAGPILRLHEHFKSIAQGQRPVPAVFFRKGDFFRDLPPLINKAMDMLTRNNNNKDDKDHKKAA